MLNTVGTGAADGARVKGDGFGSGMPDPSSDKVGGVFGLEAKADLPSVGTPEEGNLVAAGSTEAEVLCCGSFSVVSSSLSRPEMGAFASGELLVGFVDGLPAPKPNVEGVVAATGVGAATGGCLSGDPGGVELSVARVGTFFSGLSGGEGSVR